MRCSKLTVFKLESLSKSSYKLCGTRLTFVAALVGYFYYSYMLLIKILLPNQEDTIPKLHTEIGCTLKISQLVTSNCLVSLIDSNRPVLFCFIQIYL